MTHFEPSSGLPLNRIDGPAKVTGQARYAAEYPAEGLLHGSVVCSSVPRGQIRRIDCSAALAVPGVVAVLHHLDRPPMAGDDAPYQDADAAEGKPFRPLFNDRVLYSGQPVAWSSRRAWSWLVMPLHWCVWKSTLSHSRPICWRPWPTLIPRRPSCPSPEATSTGIRCCHVQGRRYVQHPQRIPQPDGAACLDGDLPGRR